MIRKLISGEVRSRSMPGKTPAKNLMDFLGSVINSDPASHQQILQVFLPVFGGAEWTWHWYWRAWCMNASMRVSVFVPSWPS
jgi:hypothetical protein